MQVAGQGLEIKSKEQHLEKRSSVLDSSLGSRRKPLEPSPWVGSCVRAGAGFSESTSCAVRELQRGRQGSGRSATLVTCDSRTCTPSQEGWHRGRGQGHVAATMSDRALVELELEGSGEVTRRGIALPGGVFAPGVQRRRALRCPDSGCKNECSNFDRPTPLGILSPRVSTLWAGSGFDGWRESCLDQEELGLALCGPSFYSLIILRLQEKAQRRMLVLHSNRPCSGMSKPQSCFGYPLSIFFIVINEFCERFSYYGMKALLILYFTRFIGWDDDLSTAIYHSFVALCYLTPILGALIADSWLGKFKTIVSLSIVYTIGQAITAISSINDLSDFNHDGTPDNIAVHVALSMTGLVLIALGTGGIKPCVSAFGGDQFEEGQEKQRNRFFSIFYLAINAGSLLSTIITPILRVQECGIHSKQACYPLAFGVPAALMAVALIVFVIGSRMYKKFQPQGNIMDKVVKCIGFAIQNRFRHRSKEFPQREHWLDWAKEKYDERLISQIKMVTRVMFLYIPLPMFWALFDQQGSRWTLQATTMSGKIGHIEIQPDQMQTVNAILIVVMVPIVDAVVYPLIAKCGFNFTPLKKMTVGMFLASMAFVAAAVVQLEIDKTLPVFPKGNQVQIKVLNIGNENMTIYFPGETVHLVQMSQTNMFRTFDVTELTSINISSAESLVTPVTPNFEEGHRHTLLVWAANHYEVVKDGLNQKPEKGQNGIRFVNAFGGSFNVTMDGKVYEHVSSHNASKYKFFPSGIKNITLSSAEIPETCNNSFTSNLSFGSAYTYVIIRKDDGCPELKEFEDISPNSVSMALQIPQYFLLTCGEVVFSVTGLEFSYSQAPSNMKSVLQAGWLLTVAVGNIIVLIVAGAGQFSKQWAEYILFASLLLVVCIIFAIMARFYTYINPAEIEAQFDEDEKKKKSENLYSTLDPVSQTRM
ncbi:solute carrier family 15 member 1 [Pteronotus mesoamericanus]|uniref:solute carrier family 15 member 1 n=1 Tax=Pteronotus mesoamericanus TaxID=1884717 RepID=UPI0023EB2D88|nr:solute carrier family 15 member 1 [Pteronotus parnellii mesoamericanus]